jgi:hypothetical protein
MVGRCVVSPNDRRARREVAAKLIEPSAIKPVLATLEQTLVIKTLGRLSARDQQRLRETIATLFG